MYLTTKIHISQGSCGSEYCTALKMLCYHAARLYNVGLYSVRQHYFSTEKYLSYYENYHLCKTNENYSLLLTDTGQQILRIVDRDMKSFFAILRLKKDGKYSDNVKLPRYKDKTGLTSYAVQGRSVRIHEDKARIGLTKEFREMYGFTYRYMEFTLPKNVEAKSLKEVRIIPCFNGTEFDVEFIYNRKEAEASTADGVLSIDPGVSNLLTCTAFSNGKPDAFIIDGRRIKSINCYYNKAMARLKAIYAKDSKVQGTTARMRRLINGRKNRIDACFNSIAKYITDYCLANGIGTIVIGYNKGQQEGIDMGKTNNQNFAYIPFYKLRRKLMNRCALCGIKYESQEESYTSKASALSLDEIPDYGDKDIPEFSGYRQKRGLYKIKGKSVTINADVNGSINIYRKYLKCKSNADLSVDDVRVFVNRPVMRISALH